MVLSSLWIPHGPAHEPHTYNHMISTQFGTNVLLRLLPSRMEDHPYSATTPEEAAAVAAAVVVAAVADAAAVTPTCSLLLHYWNSCCYRSVIEENKNDATAVLAGASHATELAKKWFDKVTLRSTSLQHWARCPPAWANFTRFYRRFRPDWARQGRAVPVSRRHQRVSVRPHRSSSHFCGAKACCVIYHQWVLLQFALSLTSDGTPKGYTLRKVFSVRTLETCFGLAG